MNLGVSVSLRQSSVAILKGNDIVGIFPETDAKMTLI